jgi:hypothetical protein
MLMLNWASAFGALAVMQIAAVAINARNIDLFINSPRNR